MTILFENKVTPEFASKVKDISYKLGIDPSELMFVMDYESGLNPQAINSGSGATGLIQFLPSTAEGLGTTTDALAAMSGVEQLDYVYDYLKTYKGDMDSVYTTYLAVFYPAALNQSDAYVFPGNVVSSNPVFFKHGNTLAAFKNGIDDMIRLRVPTAYYDTLLKKKEIFCKSIKERSLSASL